MLPIQILSFALSLFSVGCAATATATTTNESSAVTIELPKLHMEGQLINVNSTIGIVVGTASFMAQSSTDTSTFTCGGHYTLTQTDYRMTTTETVASATTTLKDQASKRTDDPLAAICDTNDPEETTACLKLKDALESLAIVNTKDILHNINEWFRSLHTNDTASAESKTEEPLDVVCRKINSTSDTVVVINKDDLVKLNAYLESESSWTGWFYSCLRMGAWVAIIKIAAQYTFGLNL